MRKKTLMVITLIAVMLFSSFLPIAGVFATDEPTSYEITFNRALYKGLKAYFEEQGVQAKYNDVKHAIYMDASVLEKIEAISLKEKGISDISGIENFKNLKSLILSANYLSEKSNLGVLNELNNLTYLDLSSNNIKDASEIESLIMKLIANDSNSLNLSGQIVNSVIDVPINLSDEVDCLTYSLPPILQFSGIAQDGKIKDQGRLKSDWFTEENKTASSVFNLNLAPRIDKRSISNPVTSEDNSFDICVGDISNDEYTFYEGLIKLQIRIKNTDNVYNDDLSSKNILKDSIFNLYYVVHPDYSKGIILKDKNLYKAVKEQLTQNQEINPELLSYKYGTENENGVIYDVCDYKLTGTTATLSINGNELYIIENFSGKSGKGVINKADGMYYNIDYEVISVTTTDDEGNVQTKRKIKVPHINLDCRDLYIDAWDEPQVLVISDVDIINNISSLILNDKRITDLSGIEFFVGLKSNLNVSYNYIDSLEAIYALQKNKDANNNVVNNVFESKKSSMLETGSKVTDSFDKIMEIKKQIDEAVKEVEKAPDDKKDEVKNQAIEKIRGDGAENKGLIGEIESALNAPQDGLNANLPKLYSRLNIMYNVYSKEYKNINILIPALNYETEEEYLAYNEKIKTNNGAKELAKAQVAKIKSLEQEKALTSLEEDLIITAFELNLDDEKENPISYALDAMISDKEAENDVRTTWLSINSKFIQIGIYSNAANYCLIERMNKDTAADICYAEKYLKQLIDDYNAEDIDTTIVKAIYEKVKDGKDSNKYIVELNDKFMQYIDASEEMQDGSQMSFCKGQYYPVEELICEITPNTGLPTDFKVYEKVNGKTSKANEKKIYDQLITLINKFEAIKDAKPITLPTLKKLDVRNNEIETLGPTEVTLISNDGTITTSTETLATLKNLKELYAGHNFVTGDIESVDWSTLKSLKKLDLSYNFISDISPLEVLTNLRYLDVSDNLLAGEFNISLRKMLNLKDLKLAGNQYTDITKILNDYEMVSLGDLTTYFARKDTLNLDLSRQDIVINITDPISYNPVVKVGEIELPPIFSQLEYIDSTRTAFGTTSSKGTVQARGGIAYVPVNEEGKYQAVVKVIAANGYPEDVSTSIGINTTCTINYTVRNTSVTTIKIEQTGIVNVEKGKSEQFTAKVYIDNFEQPIGINWALEGNTSDKTNISNDGILFVGEDETAEKLTIIASSKADSSIQARKVINVVTPQEEHTDPQNPEIPDDLKYGYKISNDGDQVLGISPNTKANNFKTKFITNAAYTAEVSREGTKVEDNEYVATNDIVVIRKGSEVVTCYELVVTGDVNGDGVANALDSSLIKAHRAKLELLSGSALTAADINNDGDITVMDVRLLMYHRAKVDGYIL